MKILRLLLLFLVGLLPACGPGTMAPSTSVGGSTRLREPNTATESRPTPHAQTLEEGEAIENQIAKEAEEKQKAEQDPANQARAEQEKIDRQIQEEQEKAEGGD